MKVAEEPTGTLQKIIEIQENPISTAKQLTLQQTDAFGEMYFAKSKTSAKVFNPNYFLIKC